MDCEFSHLYSLLDDFLTHFSYPYPLFEQLNMNQRAAVFAAAALTMTISTGMLQWLYGRVNGLKGAQKKSTPSNIKGE
jgi:hypothetical protein